MKKATGKCFSLLSALLCAILSVSMVKFSNDKTFLTAENGFVPTITAIPSSGEEVYLLEGDILEYALAGLRAFRFRNVKLALALKSLTVSLI